jgi:hypothetical protein
VNRKLASRLRSCRAWAGALLALGLGLAPRSAAAHLMPPQHGTLNLIDSAVFVVMSLPGSALAGVDDDGDGLLSAAELGAHQSAIRAAVIRRVRISDGAHPGSVDFFQLNEEHASHDAAAPPGSTHFLALMKVSFAAAPRELRVETDFWGDLAGEQELALRVTRGAAREAAVLTPDRQAHVFFSAAVAGAREQVSLAMMAVAAAGLFSGRRCRRRRTT